MKLDAPDGCPPDLSELADKVGSWVTIIMGGIFVVCVLMFRRGIVGELQALAQRMGVMR